jgi:SNF2 family DNA or RNA helicase
VKKTYGKIDFEGKRWQITCDAQVSLRFKRLFARVSVTSYGTHTLSDTTDIAYDLEWFLQRYPMTLTARAKSHMRARSDEYREQASIVQKLLSGRQRPKELQLALPLREYQLVAVTMARTVKGLLLADDVGLGKSAVGIGLISHVDARPALVVTLTHLPTQWQEELAKFAPDLKVHILKKGTPYDLTVGKRGAVEPMPDVIISNYLKLAGWAETLRTFGLRTVVFDEAQELRRRGSQKYAAAKHVSADATYRLQLTATPIYNQGDEIHSVVDVIRPDALGSRDEFLRERCRDPDRNGNAMIVDPKAFGEYMREQGLMLRRTRIEVGRELPKLTRVPHHVDAQLGALHEVSAACRELSLYILGQGQKPEHLLKHPVAETDLGADAPSGRDTGHFLASQELSWRLRQATGLAKATFIADFVRLLVEQGERVVLYGWHREVYRIWMERMENLHPVLYTGSESPREKDRAKESFLSGRSCVLVMSLRSGAGLDGLQNVSRTVVFGELDWAYGVHEQAEGRVHRDGQKDPVVAYYPTASVGSDPVIMDALGIKRGQLEGLRDPNMDLVQKLQVDSDRIKRLAEAYLQQHVE